MRWQRIVFSVTVTEGLLTEVSEKRKGCGRKAIPPVVARIFSGDSTSPLTREARMWCEARDSADVKQAERSLKGKGGARRGIIVLLQRLWGWRGWWAIPQSCDR